MSLGKQKILSQGATATPAPTGTDNFDTITYIGNGATNKITGYIQKGAGFDGNSSFIDTGITNHSLAWGYAAWVNTSNSSGNNCVLATLNGSGSNSGVDMVVQSDGKLRALFHNSGSNMGSTYQFGSGLNDGNWHFVAYTWDGINGNTATVRIDGTKYTQSTSIAGTTTHDASLKIGRFGASGGGSFFNGVIDQVRIFNKKLSDSELDTLYAEKTSNPSTVSTLDIFSDSSGVALYELDENANDTGGNYNGTSTNINFLGMAFQPDFVWVKPRSAVGQHSLFDSVRGATKRLDSSSTSAESTASSSLTSFDSNGFTFGNESGNNTNETNVAWCWKAAASNATNNDGTTQSTVRANTAAGFSIVKFAATNTSIQVGHGLTSAPNMIIWKNLDTADNWYIYHSGLSSPNTQWLKLNTTDTVVTNGTNNFSAVTSSTFTSHLWGGAGSNDIIAYCFHDVAGYQKFGTYAGTGSAGKVVTTNFQPSFLLIKATNYAGFWVLLDNKRTDGTHGKKRLYAQGTFAEDSSKNIEFNATDFTIQDGSDDLNGNYNYIYWAIA